MSNQSANLRVAKDLKELYSHPNLDSPPIHAIAVDDKLDHITSLIMGPPDTPYHFGFFLFDLRLPSTYPNEPPKVKIMTTDFGRTRLNPNLYADGKVCLSILGTWRGETAEVWRSSYSIGYVLNAVQSLILNADPYHNEPGYEPESLALDSPPAATSSAPPPASAAPPGSPLQPKERRNPDLVRAEMSAYNKKMFHESLRVGVCEVLESVLTGKQEHFKAIIKWEFITRFESYMRIAVTNTEVDGQPFLTMPFEYPGNVAEGKFEFQKLADRLNRIRQRLEEETQQWKAKGKELTQRRSYISSTLKDEHAKLNQEGIEGVSGGPASEDNAFVWEVTIFGPESSLYEEGMYNVEIVFSEDPMEIPRLRFQTPMNHPNISPSGYPCLQIPNGKQGNVEVLLLAAKKLLSGDPSPSPATWVNEEAAKMCFSKDEAERKEWKRATRKLARSTTSG